MQAFAFHGTPGNNLKIMKVFHFLSTEIRLWVGRGELEVTEEQDVGDECEGKTRTTRKPSKTQSRNLGGSVRSTCLGSHCEKVYQKLLA